MKPAIGLDEAEFAIDGVRPGAIEADWDQAWPFLEKAIARFPNVRQKYTALSIYRKLMRGEMQLWIAWDVKASAITGAATTEIVTDDRLPGKLLLSIPLVGGKDWNKWGDAMWKTLKSWGMSKGCDAALGYGRKGWQRLYGFDPIGKSADGVPIMLRILKEYRK